MTDPGRRERNESEERAMSEPLDIEEQRYREAVGASILAGEEYAGAIGGRDPERIRAAREALQAAHTAESQALDALVESRTPPAQVRVPFDALLNDPFQQLDTRGEVVASVFTYQDLTCNTACACTDPKCPRHIGRTP